MPRSMNTAPNRQARSHHRTTFNLPIELAERLAREAMFSRQTATDIVVTALEAELARRSTIPRVGANGG